MADPIFPLKTPIQPLGLAGDVLQPVPDIAPRTEEQYFQDVNSPSGLRPIQPGARKVVDAQNPMSQFTEVTPDLVDAGGAKKIDMNARQRLPGDPMSQFSQVAAPTLPGFKEADDLDLKTSDELFQSKFPSVDYFARNPDVAKDPKKLAKLLDVYRKQDKEGLTLSGVAEAAVKHGPGVIGDIAGGIKRLGERALDVIVQPTANVVLGALSGDLFDDKKRAALLDQTRKVMSKGVSEVSAGSEAATVGLVDLARTGARKIPYTGTEFEPIPLPTPKTDQQLLAQIADDAAFRAVAESASTGEGEFAKTLGLDKESLAKQGVELDPEAIRQLSLVDPITMVATGGAFKLVGSAGKVIGVARTLEGAEYLANKLSGVAKYSAGKTLQSAGKIAEATGNFAKGSGTAAGLVAGAGAAASGGGIAPSLIVGSAAKLVGPALRQGGKLAQHAGKAIVGEVPISANLQKVLDYAGTAAKAGKEIGSGALQGIAAAAPFALAADNDEAAGTLLGAGAGLGAAHAAGAGALRVVKSAAARRYFGENRSTLPDVASGDYGLDKGLDDSHRSNITKLSVQDASELNNFREALRAHGGEIYAVDAATWRQKIKEAHPGITDAQLDVYQNHSAFFDTAIGPDRKVVYLNTDTAGTNGLKHDAGHIFDSLLSPEKRAELRASVTETFGQKAIDDFRAEYEARVGNKISDKAVLDEFIAEQFNALFHNVPLEQLNAPRSLLSKFVDTAAAAAESLGIDLTNGATSPALGAPVSVGIRQIFRNAAGDIARAKVEAAPTNVVPLPEPSPAAPAAPAAPGANVVPFPSRNIRVQPESVSSFTQSSNPDARAKAAARNSETGVDYARKEAKKDDGSAVSIAIERISDSMESGNPVVQIEHLGITSDSAPAAPLGRNARRAEQAKGYADLEAAQLATRQGAPPEIVSQHSKNFVPVRWTDQGGTPTLIAMSLDKVISNILKVAADPKAKDLIPYPVENGKLTAEGWKQVVADAQAYSENQSNGRRGDGGRLTVPEAGLSIPAENPNYTPKTLTPERANFQNLVQGIAPPQTSRSQKGVLPGNVKGQILAEANKRATETPANITPSRASKQAFVEFPGRTVQETNPLRNELERRGVNTRDLIEVTERIRAKDIVSAKPRPDVDYKAPVTDIIRGGFQPAPEEFRANNLKGDSVEDFAKKIIAASPADWKTATDSMTGGLTGGAWNLGLGLKSPADVALLKSAGESLSSAAKAAMQAGDFDGAYAIVTKGQFFREAYEAATGTGSAGAAFKRGQAGMESAKPPFPADGSGFLPAEELPAGSSEPAPDIRVLPPAAAAGGRRPPGGPPLIPPPVAAGVVKKESDSAGFQPGKEELTGLAFKDFFSKVTKGEFGKSKVPWVPIRDISGSKDFLSAVQEHSGNFDEHIAKSIPGYRETQIQKGEAIVNSYPKGARVLDVGGSEGAWDKAISQKSGGKIETVVVDPNPDMAEFFRSKSQVPGATYSESAWGRGFEDGGKTIPAFDDPKKFDVVNESMVFQFISPERAAQVAEAKRLLKPDGIFLSDEKLRSTPERWAANESKKDKDYKSVYFTDDELKAKDEVVGFQQAKAETKAVGMVDNMAGVSEYESTLRENFAHVAQYWDSGNFKGYVASDSESAIQRFLDNLGDTKTEFSTLSTPRGVTGGNFQPRTDAGRKLEERGFKIETEGGFGIRKVSVTKDGDDVAVIQSVQRSPERAEIAMVQKYKGAPKGVGEVLYRELGSQLKEDGVTKVEGNVISPEPLAIRKKVFGDFESLDVNGEPSDYQSALDTAERIKNRTENEVAAIEPVNTITPESLFQPKVKRDEQGRPLKKNGEIDFARWQAEGLAARKQRERESDKKLPVEASAPKPKTNEPKSATGWILPDKKFVPLDTNYHEQFLAENADSLNKKFDTSFSSDGDEQGDARLAALNKGFVRIRDYNGRVAVEVNADRWPTLRAKVRDTLQDLEEKIDNLTVSLLDKNGKQVDSTNVPRMNEMEPAEKLGAIDDAVNKVRGGGAFLPGDALPGFEDKTPEELGRAKAARRVSTVKKNNPEAVIPQMGLDLGGDVTHITKKKK